MAVVQGPTVADGALPKPKTNSRNRHNRAPEPSHIGTAPTTHQQSRKSLVRASVHVFGGLVVPRPPNRHMARTHANAIYLHTAAHTHCKFPCVTCKKRQIDRSSAMLCQCLYIATHGVGRLCKWSKRAGAERMRCQPLLYKAPMLRYCDPSNAPEPHFAARCHLRRRLANALWPWPSRSTAPSRGPCVGRLSPSLAPVCGRHRHLQQRTPTPSRHRRLGNGTR